MNHDNDAGFSGEEEDTSASECYSDDDGIDEEPHRVEIDVTKTVPVAEHQVLSAEQVKTEMAKIAADTSAILNFPPPVCKILLHYSKWNKESLIEKFYDAETQEQFLDKMKLKIPMNPSVIGRPQVYKCGECQICYMDNELLGLSCGHRYCGSCWSNYLSTRFREFPDPYACCPDPECKLIADDECAKKLLLKPADKKFYEKLTISSFVDSNNYFKWCPGVDCGKIIKSALAEATPVTCDCGTCFCFNCSQEWHEPVNCELLKLWIKKCSDDSETSNWLNANTKDCPQCHVTIEKDGGCNHMTCRSSACRFEFCWTCLGPWSPHGSGWYSCNRYEDKDAKTARSAQENSRAALNRYLHYYNRYANHQNSLKFENRLLETIRVKAEQLQSAKFSWIETQFLTNAVSVLNKCRRTLMYTYAFAFYLQQNNMSRIFEDNQQDLELATEQLSEVLEREIDPAADDLVALKQKVQDKYRYVDLRRLALLKHCAEGLDRNEWVFIA